MLKDTLFSLVDVETTGGSPAHNHVIEVAVIQLLNGKVVNTYQQLVNPQRRLSPFITELTGITDEMLEDQPTFDEISDQLFSLLQGSIFTAHNARFDYSFLKHEFSRHHQQLTLPTLCTVRLSRKLFPQYAKHSLDTLIERFGFAMDDRHRAYADTFALQQFFEVLPQYFSEEVIEQEIRSLMKRYVLPSHVPQEHLESLPQSPGVYTFYGEHGAPLYIGKSIHIKERVFQHFAKAHDSSKELALLQQLRHIECNETASELGALLLESQMIKELKPLYNKRLRSTKEPIVAVYEQNEDGYYTPKLTTIEKVPKHELIDIIGIYKSKKQLKQSFTQVQKVLKLCPKLMGIEHSTSACFQYQLHQCHGACLGIEPVHEYNMRFLEAFQSSRMSTWPYEGSIMITEYDKDKTKGEVFFVDQWCLLAQGTFEDGQVHINQQFPPRFEKDIYHILRQYINTPHHNQNIQLVRLEDITAMLSDI